MFKFISKLFDANTKEIQKLLGIVDRVNSFEIKNKKLKESDFVKKTKQLQEELTHEDLNNIMPEAFALAKEAARRAIGERPFDVQLMAAIALHQGKVAEQKTGEGKTLSASLPLYLNALSGKGAHLVTVNDYLARIGCGWMGPVYHLLGLSVSAIIHDQSFTYDPNYTDETATDWRLRVLKPISRKEAYRSDITYGVNSEFGFDYLRDNMVSDSKDQLQRKHYFAIVDEVDSVLIDEARTPHIISAPDTEPTKKYYDCAQIVGKLNLSTDFEIDEKHRTAHLTEHGIANIEKMMGKGNIYEEDFQLIHHLEAALKAKTLFKKDKDYIVRDGQVIIVDEFTGRLLAGRRFSEGLHQAIEAKENVVIQQESKTLAVISLQNYFRRYQKLAGMTGTAATEAEEFRKIYNLDVVVVPTHKPLVRQDHPDSVYKTMRAKYSSVVESISECAKTGQPVLVGTTSITNNEIIGDFLRRKGIKHNLLNAKNHEREASIIADAGKKGAVTVATNMAGRGVDILLGGTPPNKYVISDKKEYEELYETWKKNHQEVVKLNGLYVIGTERHESRRIDNQLRGRAGRQGDPGNSKFFVSLEDEIMRLFGGEQIASLMTRFNLPENQPLEHPLVSRAIEQAQVKVEGFHFDSRKHLVDYDDVLNKHREIIYSLRQKVILPETDLKEFVLKRGLESREYEKKEKEVGKELMIQIIRWVSLQVIDRYWMEHLTVLEDLREGIGLRGYGQRDPLVEYKNEAFSLFDNLIRNIDLEIADKLLKVQLVQKENAGQKTALQEAAAKAIYRAASEQNQAGNANQAIKARPIVSGSREVGRNDPCPCGAVNPTTGKTYKYKKCGLINAPHHKG